MTQDKNAANENQPAEKEEPKGGHPGPTDQGKDGGMATRELAPDLADD